jgi:hypothetical protein
MFESRLPLRSWLAMFTGLLGSILLQQQPGNCASSADQEVYCLPLATFWATYSAPRDGMSQQSQDCSPGVALSWEDKSFETPGVIQLGCEIRGVSEGCSRLIK